MVLDKRGSSDFNFSTEATSGSFNGRAVITRIYKRENEKHYLGYEMQTQGGDITRIVDFENMEDFYEVVQLLHSDIRMLVDTFGLDVIEWEINTSLGNFEEEYVEGLGIVNNLFTIKN